MATNKTYANISLKWNAVNETVSNLLTTSLAY